MRSLVIDRDAVCRSVLIFWQAIIERHRAFPQSAFVAGRKGATSLGYRTESILYMSVIGSENLLARNFATQPAALPLDIVFAHAAGGYPNRQAFGTRWLMRTDNLGMSPKQFTPRRVLRVACVCLLLAGFLSATSIFIATSNVDPSNDAASLQATSIRLDQNRREMAEVERLGGKVSVMTVQFHQWFLSLWQERRLAYTLMALAIVVAWLCWYIAELMEDEHVA